MERLKKIINSVPDRTIITRYVETEYGTEKIKCFYKLEGITTEMGEQYRVNIKNVLGKIKE